MTAPEPLDREAQPSGNTAARQELVEAILLAQARGMTERAIRELFARDGLTWHEKLKALRVRPDRKLTPDSIYLSEAILVVSQEVTGED